MKLANSVCLKDCSIGYAMSLPIPTWKKMLRLNISVRTLIEQIQLISRKGLDVIGDDIVT